jgi:hypothetical protein
MSSVSNHPFNTRSFEQFRAFYTLPKRRKKGAFTGLQMILGSQRHRPENDIYDYYLSAAQNPLVAQQVNTAASRLFEEALTQMIPSWTELLRMGIRSAQELWISRRPSIFGGRTKNKTETKTKTKTKTLSLKHDEWPRRFYRWI